VAGLRFEWDASKPSGSRIRNVTVGGKLLDPSAKYTIATSNFLVANSGDGYTMFKEGKVLNDPATAPKDSDMFEQAIKAAPNSAISPVADGRNKRIN
jgi:5'-nucleotidase